MNTNTNTNGRTVWGAYLKTDAGKLWACQDGEGQLCFYPHDEEGQEPQLRLACDSREELDEVLGACWWMLVRVEYDL